ncbi:hypothetical protein F4604DRAFT_1689234 [Suillus subluteus]|nr:hypothetical protein F4604DRAFT_1689234 [Suillus subluteus]
MPAPKGAKGGPTGSTITSPSAGPATRQSTKTPLSQSEIEAVSNAVSNYTSATKYLNKNLLSLPDEPYILMHITQMRDNIPLLVTTAIRAAAFVLKKHAACEMATEVAQQLTDTLTPRIIEHIVGAIAPQMAKLLSTSDQLSDTLDWTEAVRKALANDRDEMNDGLQISASDTKDTDINIDKHQHQTYSSIVTSNLSPSIDKAIGRAAIRARQILLDPTLGTTLFPPGTSHGDMVKKAKSALANTREVDTPVGDVKSQTLQSLSIIMASQSLAGVCKLQLAGPYAYKMYNTAGRMVVASFMPARYRIQLASWLA